MKVTDTKEIRAVPSGARGVTERPAPVERSVVERVSTADSDRLATVIAAATQSEGAGRAAKLASIETAVRQGTYRPDAQRIAQEILDDAELAARLQALLRG